MAVTVATTMDRFPIALQTIIETALPGVIVSDGIPPAGQFDAKDWIQIGDIDFEIDVKAMNRTTQPREERYVQEMLISVVKSTRAGQAAASARAWELYAAIHDAVRADVSLSAAWTDAVLGTGNTDGQIIAAVFGAGRLSKRVDEANSLREAAIEFGINVHARI